MNQSKVVRAERGWAGHYCCSDRCLFRRNTLLTYCGTEIVVSTVGLKKNINGQFEEIGAGRHYETMAFYSEGESRYHDADIHKSVGFCSRWAIGELDADDKANNMHEAVCKELTEKLENGDFL